MKYDFTFFASSQAYGNVNTAYTINDKKCILNASLNTDGIVTINNVIPDKNGEVIISVSPNSILSQYGLIGALIIKEYNISDKEIPLVPQSSAYVNSYFNNNIENKSSTHSSKLNITASKTIVYPNPFRDDFTISISLLEKDDIEVQLYGISGMFIAHKDFGILQQGLQNLRMIPNSNIPAGAYYIKIVYTNAKKSDYIKILKQ